MIDRIMDELIGMKNTAIAYFFENLEIGILDIQGPKEQQIDSGKFTIKGGIKISTELDIVIIISCVTIGLDNEDCYHRSLSSLCLYVSLII
jgi:hypothetical protein